MSTESKVEKSSGKKRPLCESLTLGSCASDDKPKSKRMKTQHVESDEQAEFDDVGTTTKLIPYSNTDQCCGAAYKWLLDHKRELFIWKKSRNNEGKPLHYTLFDGFWGGTLTFASDKQHATFLDKLGQDQLSFPKVRNFVNEWIGNDKCYKHCADFDLKLTRKLSEEDLLEYAQLYHQCVCDAFANGNTVTDCIVLLSYPLNFAEEDGKIFKNGLHIIYSNLPVNQDISQAIRLLALPRFEAQYPGEKWVDIIDAKIYSTGLRGPYQLKAIKCTECKGANAEAMRDAKKVLATKKSTSEQKDEARSTLKQLNDDPCKMCNNHKVLVNDRQYKPRAKIEPNGDLVDLKDTNPRETIKQASIRAPQGTEPLSSDSLSEEGKKYLAHYLALPKQQSSVASSSSSTLGNNSSAAAAATKYRHEAKAKKVQENDDEDKEWDVVWTDQEVDDALSFLTKEERDAWHVERTEGNHLHLTPSKTHKAPCRSCGKSKHDDGRAFMYKNKYGDVYFVCWTTMRLDKQTRTSAPFICNLRTKTKESPKDLLTKHSDNGKAQLFVQRFEHPLRVVDEKDGACYILDPTDAIWHSKTGGQLRSAVTVTLKRVVEKLMAPYQRRLEDALQSLKHKKDELKDNEEIDKDDMEELKQMHQYVKECRKALQPFESALAAVQSKKCADCVVSFVKSHPLIFDQQFESKLDKVPHIMAICDNLVFDFKAGTTRPRTPDDMCSFFLPVRYKPAAQRHWPDKKPQSEAEHDALRSSGTIGRGKLFCMEVANWNRDLAEEIRASCGYFITGETSARKAHIWQGEGMNGKSSLLSLLRKLHGGSKIARPRCIPLPKDILFMRGHEAAQGAATPGLMGLKHAWLAVCEETKKLESINEEVMRMLANEFPWFTARDLHKGQEQFSSQAKLLLVVNKEPKIDIHEQANRDRVCFVNFPARFDKTERNSKWVNSLEKGEGLDDVFSEFADAAHEFYTNGHTIKRALLSEQKQANYYDKLDNVNIFLRERTNIDVNRCGDDDWMIKKQLLRNEYEGWILNQAGYHQACNSDWGEVLRKHGLREKRHKGINVWMGIQFRREDNTSSAKKAIAVEVKEVKEESKRSTTTTTKITVPSAPGVPRCVLHDWANCGQCALFGRPLRV